MEESKPSTHQLSISPPETPALTFTSHPAPPVSTETYRPALTHKKPPRLPSLSPAAPPKTFPRTLFDPALEASPSRASAGIQNAIEREMIKIISWPHAGPSSSSPAHSSPGQSVPRRLPPPAGSSSAPISSPQVDRVPRWTTEAAPPRHPFGPSQSSLPSITQSGSSSQPSVRPSKQAPLQRSRTAPQIVPETQVPHISRSAPSSQPMIARPLPQVTDIPPQRGSSISPASTYMTADGSQGSRKQLSVSPLTLSGQNLPPPKTSPTAGPSRVSARPQVLVTQRRTPSAPGLASVPASDSAPAVSISPQTPGPGLSTIGTAKILEIARARLQQAMSNSAKVAEAKVEELELAVTPNGSETSDSVEPASRNDTIMVDQAESTAAAVAEATSRARTRPHGSENSAASSTNSQPIHSSSSQVSAAKRGHAIVAEIKNALVGLSRQLADLKTDVASLPTHGDLEQLQSDTRAQFSECQDALSAWQAQNRRLSHEYTKALEDLPRRGDFAALESTMVDALVPRAGFERTRSDLDDQMAAMRTDVGTWQTQAQNEGKAQREQLDQEREAGHSDHAALLARLDSDRAALDARLEQLEKSLATKTLSAEVHVVLSAHSSALSAVDSRLAALSGQIAGKDGREARTRNREALSTALQPILDKQSELASTQAALSKALDELRAAIPPSTDVQDEVRKGLQSFFSQFEAPSASPIEGSSDKTSPARHLGEICPSDHEPEPSIETPIDRPKHLMKAPLLSTFAEDEDEDELPGAEGPLFDDSLGPSIADDLPALSEVDEGYEAGVNSNTFKWQNSFHGQGDGAEVNGDSQSSGPSAVSKGEDTGLDVTVNLNDEPVQDREMGEGTEAEARGGSLGVDTKMAPSPFDFSDHPAFDKQSFPSVQTFHPPTPPPEVSSPTEEPEEITRPISSKRDPNSFEPSRKPPSRSRSITARLDPSPSIQPKSIKRSASGLTSDSKDSKPGNLVKKRKTGPRAERDPQRLAKSDGKARGAGKWPGKGPLTDIGLLQTIECENCHGRAHWTCAGLRDDETGPVGDWQCPDCVAALAANTPREDIEQAPRNRCIRRSCVRRSNQKIHLDQAGGRAYLVDRIIGRVDSRTAVSRNADGSRNFDNLIVWQGYPLAESTWEPDANLGPHLDSLLKAYNTEREAQGLDSKPRVVLLKEATATFDQNGKKITR